MPYSIVTVLLWIAAISSGLMAGVYFAFSGFIMQAFKSIESSHSLAAMNAINVTILRSLFMPLFFVSSIVSVLLIVYAIVYWSEANGLMLLAGVIYFIGMFVCTVVFNVPLNNTLLKLESSSANTAIVWSRYLKVWTAWNHVRTLSSLITFILCIWLLCKY